jgi:MerR family copper efflux transcriptional regulator
MNDALHIGDAAATAGVPTPTLRFYERRGLVKPVTRSSAGYRMYSPDDVRTVRFIKRAQGLGFSLREVWELLSLRDSRRPCAEVRAAAEAKLTDVEAKLEQLADVRRALRTLVRTCGKGQRRSCPILDALSEASSEA